MIPDSMPKASWSTLAMGARQFVLHEPLENTSWVATSIVSVFTPSTIAGKMTWAKDQGLGGAFFWDFSGDTSNGELVTAVSNGLA